MSGEASAPARPPEPLPGLSARRLLGKAAVLLAIVVVGTLTYRFTPLKEWFEPAGRVASWVREAGLAGALGFYGITATLILLGVPRLLFCPLAGALYGLWGGLALSVAAPATSYFVTFLFLRGKKDGPVEGLPAALRFLTHDPGFSGVFLARLIPLPGMLITLALSLSGVGRRKYLVGTLLGMIPEAAPLVLLGAGLVGGGPHRTFHFGALALVCVGITWFAIRRVRRRHRARTAASGPPVAGA